MKPINDKFLWDIIDGLRDNINCHIDTITDMDAVINELKAENERLKELNPHEVPKEFHTERYEKLQAENKQLTQTIKYSNGNDGLYDEVVESNEYLEEQIKELKADNKRLYKEHKECRLMSQVSSNRSNNSNGRTISGEIDEYMSHNEGCGGARLFLIPFDEFKNDEYDETIYWDDGIE